jgi:transcriptional regulator NrdR family protein
MSDRPGQFPCPGCGNGRCALKDSRPNPRGRRRRRICLDCGLRFATLEISEDDAVHVSATTMLARAAATVKRL